MSQIPTQFDQPELKAAIARVKGGHVASAELRAKVLRVVEEVRGGSKTASNGDHDQPNRFDIRTARLRRWGPGTWISAVAALLLVAIGGMYVKHVLHERHEAAERAEYFEANETILTAMVAAHEGGCAKDPSHVALTSAMTDLNGMATEAGGKLGRFVPAPKLDGWKVQSASICNVNNVPAAHWLMSKNGKTISFLSFPQTAFKIDEEYDTYDFVVEKHAIAGYLHKGGVHCVVCDPSMTAQESIELRDALRRG